MPKWTEMLPDLLGTQCTLEQFATYGFRKSNKNERFDRHEDITSVLKYEDFLVPKQTTDIELPDTMEQVFNMTLHFLCQTLCTDKRYIKLVIHLNPKKSSFKPYGVISINTKSATAI